MAANSGLATQIGDEELKRLGDNLQSYTSSTVGAGEAVLELARSVPALAPRLVEIIGDRLSSILLYSEAWYSAPQALAAAAASDPKLTQQVALAQVEQLMNSDHEASLGAVRILREMVVSEEVELSPQIIERLKALLLSHDQPLAVRVGDWATLAYATKGTSRLSGSAEEVLSYRSPIRT